MRLLLALLLSACAVQVDDGGGWLHRHRDQDTQYLWACDEDGGPETCHPYDWVCLEGHCRWIPVVEIR